MSATCTWTHEGVRTNVTVTRRDGTDPPSGYWEARECGTGKKVMVRPEDLGPAFTITTGGAS
jgi:hypothetical protein